MIAALVLALSIGANTAVFTIVDGVLLQPLPFPEPGRLFLISCKPKEGLLFDPGPTMVDRSYLEFRQHNQSFENLAALGRKRITLTGSGDPVVVTASTVTSDFLRVLDVHPAIGRGLLREGEAGANAALLSNHLWRSRFSGDTSIVGKAITLDSVSYLVAGVMPATFTFQSADLWIRAEIRLVPNDSYFLPVIGRLKPGVSPRQAQAELQAFAATLPLDQGENRDSFVTSILPLKELFVADVRKLLLIFAGAAAFVFLIACAILGICCSFGAPGGSRK